MDDTTQEGLAGQPGEQSFLILLGPLCAVDVATAAVLLTVFSM